MSASALLRVRGLGVKYRAAGTQAPAALTGIDFDIRRGEITGILGESGSGKSTLALSILGLLPASAEIAGSILLEDTELMSSGWSAVRGSRMAMVFQEPGLSLSPVMRVGDQLGEVLRAHKPGGSKVRKQRVETILQEVGFAQADRIYRAYPHQLSGGELHRVAIAQSLVCHPEVVIADEPTQSLDATRQAEILQVLRETNRKFGCAIIFITHDPALLAGFADRVIVMYAGRIVEEGPVSRVFRRPLHPYTRGLLELVPTSLQGPGRTFGQRLPALPGTLSPSDHSAPGCIFASRCSVRTPVCQTEPPAEVVPEEGRRVACFNYGN